MSPNAPPALSGFSPPRPDPVASRALGRASRASCRAARTSDLQLHGHRPCRMRRMRPAPPVAGRHTRASSPAQAFGAASVRPTARYAHDLCSRVPWGAARPVPRSEKISYLIHCPLPFQALQLARFLRRWKVPSMRFTDGSVPLILRLIPLIIEVDQSPASLAHRATFFSLSGRIRCHTKTISLDPGTYGGPRNAG